VVKLSLFSEYRCQHAAKPKLKAMLLDNRRLSRRQAPDIWIRE
jgi:hypothetical protein